MKNLESLLNTYQKETRRNYDLIQVRRGLQATQMRKMKESTAATHKGEAERQEYYEGYPKKLSG